MAESNEIRYDIKADVSGGQKVKGLTEELKDQKAAVEGVGKASEEAKKTVAGFTEAINDAGKVGNAFKKIGERFNESKIGTLMNTMTPDQAAQFADQTTKLDLLERKVTDARESLANLYNEGVTGSRLTKAIETAQKAQAAYNAELEKTYSHEGQQVATIITPDQASELANQIGEIQRLSTNLDYAKQKFADFSNQRLLGDDSAETAKRIADWATKIQKLEGQLASAISASNQFASGASNVASQAEAAADGVNEYASATARLGQASIGAPEEQLALPAPSYLDGSAADEVVWKFQEVPSVFDRITDAVEAAKSAVANFAESAGISSAIDGATDSVLGFANALDTMRRSGKKAHSLLEKIVSSFKRIMFYRIVRSIIKEIGQAFGEGINNLYQWSKLLGGEFSQSMDKLATAGLYLKNSIGAALAPLINALAPVIDFIVDKFVALINVLNQVFALLAGATYWTKAIKYPKQYAKAAKGAGDATKKLGLAGIDELTILDKGKGSSSGGFTADDYAGMFEDMNEFDGRLAKIIGRIKKTFDDVMAFIQKHLASLKVILAGAALALGAILFLTGANVPLGLGLMVAGAVGLASEISANWDSMTPELESTIAAITGMVGGALLTLGAILAFSGVNVPLGIAFMAAGAVALGAGIAVNWHSMDGHIEDTLTGIAGIVSGALIAIGGILAFSGANVPLGIALMAAGAIGLAAAISVAWNNLESPMKRSIGTITTIVSTALLAIGALLAVTGVNVPLGLALIVAGGIGVATAAVKWDFASSKVRTEMTAITTIAGMSLLALGLMLVLTGANAPLGIGMIIAGGASLASAVAINWNFLTDKVDKMLKDVKQKWLDFRNWFKQKWEDLKSWWSGLTLPSFKIKKPRITWTTEAASGWVASVLSALGMPTSIPKMHVEWYANGGFPDAGQLFVANEAGAEMVGSMDGRTAVANNQQIVDGIRAGVYDAVTSAMASGSFSANVYLDGKQISGTVVNNINSETRRTGSSPLLSY